MRSESSKNLANLPLWRAETDCDERTLGTLLKAFVQEVRSAAGGSGAWILLEGPLGAGKSTAARLIIRELGVSASAEGSPTFALAHEYDQSKDFSILHLDLYRLETFEEAQAAGIPAYFWERPGALVLSEWTSKFPDLIESLLSDSGIPLWCIRLEPTKWPELRKVEIFRR